MLLKDIWLDVKAVQDRDPAARSALEVLLLYQGVHALIWHRIAHWFWTHNMRFLGRLISQIARFFTLITIPHPWSIRIPCPKTAPGWISIKVKNLAPDRSLVLDA